MNIENVEKNKVKLTFSVTAERFEEGLKFSYNKNKSKFKIQGFRPGKAPRKMIETMYGKEVLFEDALDFVLGDAYENALTESGIDAVSRPQIDVLEISPESGVTFTAEVFVKPEVSIDGYNGLTYKKTDTDVTDAEIQREIDAAREKNSRLISITDRKTKDGDVLTIDFEGSIDGVTFEGGKAENYELTIGSKMFIDNFEEQLVGYAIDDEVDVNVTFPEDYNAENLAGKPALFKVKIKEIKERELPEANDDFAQDVSEFNTLSEYKDNIKEKLSGSKQERALKEKEAQVMDALIKKAEMDVPQVMIENQVNSLIYDFEQNMKRQGITLDVYLKYVGQTRDDLRKSYTLLAESQVKGMLALEAVAAKEGFEVTEEEMDAELTKMGERYGISIDKIKETMRPDDFKMIKNDLKTKKALDLVLEKAIETE